MDEHVGILDGTTFLVCDESGDILATPDQPVGLFAHDTRLLSKWVLTVDGQRLSTLSVDDIHYFENKFYLVPGHQDVYVNSTLSVVRRHTLTTGLQEDLTVINHGGQPVDVTIRVDVDADFADLFQVKDAAPERKGHHYRRIDDGRLILGYERERFRRETIVSVTAPATLDEDGVTFEARIDPHHTWHARLTALPDLPVPRGLDGLVIPRRVVRNARQKEHRLLEWLDQAPRLESDWAPLSETYRQSLIDLAALRFSPFLAEDKSVPAAGLPWFMSLFGRDSIFTSLQALPFAPELAATTLRVLAFRQGSRVDDFREEEPGRILHEMRYGELTAFDETPHSPYFGSADATPLFLVLLDEYERWTGDAELVRSVEQEARAAIDWINDYADLTGSGYISYERRNTRNGLENQCWKDSWDGICYRDGRLPGFPRATCELQGYAYDAKIRTARLARELWGDPAYADRLEREAADLKRRFNRDFWVADGEYMALALDGDGRQVDALSSNIGHLLWSGIVEEPKAEALVRHLMSPALFSGWGVRTLAEGQGRFNPIGYHVGTIWPFDNSFIAWGLRRYGYADEAARIAAGILDAAAFYQGRLPEAFAGYSRSQTKYPVSYPTACSPQAWSAGATLLLLRTMLGLRPLGEDLVIRPALPANLAYVALLDIPGRWGRLDAYGRGPAATEARRYQPAPHQISAP
ncbi:amylo-alpha-1,6-glucosidase [Micromonospora sagamiensis]|uniref:Glycogen debranching enzyme n=1 Tax=Micromonospora sagamiensis TaxID=47875 RepID=A0A562WF96_9ACTN|nr:glycogen debranching N-terminal domain-containing protein [Micromonospora sagamiensis]TWJ28858.1 glycogen debranching enzyme [Micromonospora sagamiensis]BCL18116.1 amylo-alpha-1,6-glucosidase [Micromonospora sagamiensis]